MHCLKVSLYTRIGNYFGHPFLVVVVVGSGGGGGGTSDDDDDDDDDDVDDDDDDVMSGQYCILINPFHFSFVSTNRCPLYLFPAFLLICGNV